jgi:hypothetical protein
MNGIKAVTLNGTAMVLAPSDIDTFRRDLRGKLLTPADVDYEAARRIWNAMIDKRPALIARCEGAADVGKAVRFAVAHDLLVSVRGGGHNVAGTAVCNGGLMIDLSLMRGSGWTQSPILPWPSQGFYGRISIMRHKPTGSPQPAAW